MRYGMFRATLLLCVFVLSIQSAPPEIDPAKEADIRRLVNLTLGEETIQNISQQMLKYSGGQLKRDLEQHFQPELAGKIMDAYGKEVSEWLSVELKHIAIPLYDKYFTHEEIRSLVQFYESPAGRRFVEVQPQLTGDTMASLSQRVGEISRQAFQEVEKEFPELRILYSEPSALGSVRTIVTSCVIYVSTYPERGFPARLVDMAPPAAGTEAGPDAADLLDGALASGTKNGYRFKYVASDTDGDGTLDAFQVSARPVEYGKTGNRSFFTDESGVIRSTKEDRPANASNPPVQ